jgi:hypothetical protein
MRLSPLIVLVCALTPGCGPGEQPAAEPGWSFVPPALDPPAQLDAARVASVVQDGLSSMLAVDPSALDPVLEILYEELEGCAGGYAASDQTFRVWFESDCGEAGGVEGFAYQDYGEVDPSYDGTTGTSSYTYWSGRAWSGEVELSGVAYWGWQDVVLADGTIAVGSWFDGELQTDPAHEPDWFVGQVAPNVYQSRYVYPDGVVSLELQGSMPIEAEDVDAVSVTGLVVGEECATASGLASVHARGGGWYDLELAGTGAGCEACGEVTDADGASVGTTCVDLQTMLTLGGA